MAEGELKKLKIQSYKDAELQEEDTSFEVQVNPSEYSLNYNIEYDDAQGQGTSGSAQKFTAIKPQDLTLNFTLDGTGVLMAEQIDVKEQVDAFLKVAYDYQGDEHRPRFLKINWGALEFRCTLKSAGVNYTLFDPSGKPLRAKISATFTGFIEDQRRVAEEDSNSPDLTHRRTVHEGDSLPHDDLPDLWGHQVLSAGC